MKQRRRRRRAFNNMPPFQEGLKRNEAAYLFYCLAYMEGRNHDTISSQDLWECLRTIALKRLTKGEIVAKAKRIMSRQWSNYIP